MNYRKKYYDEYVTIHIQPKEGAFTKEDYENWASGTLTHVSKWLPNDRTVPILDIGCGSGKLLFMFQGLGYENLTGVDLSPEQIQHARLHIDQALIVQGDVRDFLKDSIEKYGLICALDVIEHFRKEEIIPLLELIYEALKPGGSLIIQTPNGESPWLGSVGFGDFTHEWFFTPTGLEHILRLVGFDRFQASETGPVIHGFVSLIRWLLWRVIRYGLKIWNMAETGGAGSGIYTRVFVATAFKTGLVSSGGS